MGHHRFTHEYELNRACQRTVFQTHARRFGYTVVGRAPGWSGPNRVNNKQVGKRYERITSMGSAAEYKG